MSNTPIDINFDKEDREKTQQFKQVCQKYENAIMQMVKSNGGFRFKLNSLELIYLRSLLEFFLKFPNLQEKSSFCYDSTKDMIENVDTLLRNAGYSHLQIATLEKPKDQENLRPVINKVAKDFQIYEFTVNPVEFGFLQGAIIMNLREGTEAKWSEEIMKYLKILLNKCNDKLRKLNFSEEEIYLMNNQLVGEDFDSENPNIPS